MRLYFILDDAVNCVKIGISRDPDSRVGQLQTGNRTSLRLLGHVPGSPALEAQVHQVLASWRKAGEWFHYAGDVRAFVKNSLAYGSCVPALQDAAVRNIVRESMAERPPIQGNVPTTQVSSKVELERLLRTKCGLSKMAAKRIVFGGWPALVREGPPKLLKAARRSSLPQFDLSAISIYRG